MTEQINNQNINNNVDPLLFWQYNKCQAPDINITQFQNYKSKTSLNEDIIHFYNNIIQSAVHPSIIKAKLLELDKIEEIREIVFNNIKVDRNTIKVLFSILTKLKVISLKFSDNNFDYDNLELLLNYLFTTSINVYCLKFEWNSKIIKNKQKTQIITVIYY